MPVMSVLVVTVYKVRQRTRLPFASTAGMTDTSVYLLQITPASTPSVIVKLGSVRMLSWQPQGHPRAIDSTNRRECTAGSALSLGLDSSQEFIGGVARGCGHFGVSLAAGLAAGLAVGLAQCLIAGLPAGLRQCFGGLAAGLRGRPEGPAQAPLQRGLQRRGDELLLLFLLKLYAGAGMSCWLAQAPLPRAPLHYRE